MTSAAAPAQRPSELPPQVACASLTALESEAIHMLRDAIAEARNPVLLFSAGKDSTVLAYLACRAFYPSRPPVPLLHIDSTWEFRELLQFRDRFAHRYGFDLRVHHNDAGRAAGVNPFEHGDRDTRVMRTEALKTALDAGRYDIILGGTRRDEERSRAKERIVSLRGPHHTWEPRRQRPELWNLFKFRLGQHESARVFPLSNWTELDGLTDALVHDIELAPLYLARPRPVLMRDGQFMVVDEPQRRPLQPAEIPEIRKVRLRTLGGHRGGGGGGRDARSGRRRDPTLSPVRAQRSTRRSRHRWFARTAQARRVFLMSGEENRP